MAGDRARGLASVGLTAATMADVWDIQQAAYAQMGDGAKTVEHARASAALDAIAKRGAP